MHTYIESGAGRRVDHAGWIYVTLTGEPFERGRQHGFLLAPELKYALDAGDFTSRPHTGESLAPFAGQASHTFGRLDEEYEEEIRGILAGAAERGIEVTRDLLIAWNGYVELLGNQWTPRHPDSPAPPKGRPHRRSAFVCTGDVSADGSVVMAHGSWDRHPMGDARNVILDIRPTTGHRMLTQGAPGCLIGTMDWVLTDAGLMITETTIGEFPGHEPARDPEFQRSRRAAQYGSTMRDWHQAMVKDNSGGYARTWLLGEAGTRKIARFALGLGNHEYEEKESGCFTGFDENGTRRPRWDRLFAEHRGKVDVALAQRMIAAWGAMDGKAMDSEMASAMTFHARWKNRKPRNWVLMPPPRMP